MFRLIFTRTFNFQKVFSNGRRNLSTYEMLKVDSSKEDHIGLICMNRPKALNALCKQLCDEIADALDKFELDDSIGCVILTGSGKAFAAGADIKELSETTQADLIKGNVPFKSLDKVSSFRKPIIACVNGYAFGGGCELAMMCDIIYASKSSLFGQPEINLGVIPGAGGTQRLARLVGKSNALEMILTGDQINAEEALRIGLVSKVFEPDMLIVETMSTAKKIASKSMITSQLCKKAVNEGYDLSLTAGLQAEFHNFAHSFATKDKQIGVSAFLNKAKPVWEHE